MLLLQRVRRCDDRTDTSGPRGAKSGRSDQRCPLAEHNLDRLPVAGRVSRKGGGAYVDIISWHLYTNYQPELDEPVAAGLRDVLARRGLSDRPIWNTEGNIVRHADQRRLGGRGGRACLPRSALVGK